VAQQLPDPLRAELLGTARDAFAHAFQITAVISAVLALIMAVIAAILLRQRSSS